MLRFCFFITTIVFTHFVLAEKNSTPESKISLNKEIIGKSKKWTVISANPNENNVCYGILYVTERQGNQKIEEETPYIMVHYFSAHKMRFSAYLGYKLLEERPVHISIDSTQYKMKPLEFYAIAESALQEEEIVNHIKNAQTILIRGEGKNYSYSVDKYEIDGFNEVFKVMQENCSFNDDNSTFATIVPSKKHIKKLEGK